MRTKQLWSARSKRGLLGRAALVVVVTGLAALAGGQAASMRQQVDRLQEQVASAERQLESVERDIDDRDEELDQAAAHSRSSVSQADLDEAIDALRGDVNEDIRVAVENRGDYATAADLAAVGRELSALQASVRAMRLSPDLSPSPASAEVQADIAECLAWVYEEVRRYRDGQSPSIYFAPQACYSLSR